MVKCRLDQRLQLIKLKNLMDSPDACVILAFLVVQIFKVVIDSNQVSGVIIPQASEI